MRKNIQIIFIIALVALMTFQSAKATSKYKTTGVASYYANFFNGRKTANGEIFSNNAMTAAHRKLPFGTKVRVTNISNGKSIIVRINDRGPYVGNREIDLSKKAFSKIESTHRGLTKVRVEVL